MPNYLLSNRKRLALSQADVAYLLGSESGEMVCRHERFRREPSLEVVFAYEIIFKRAASELFGGLYQEIEQEVIERARTLLMGLKKENSNPRKIRRFEAIAEIAGIKSNTRKRS